MISRCLSTSGLCFLRHPVPTEGLGIPYGLLTGREVLFQTSLGFPRSARTGDRMSLGFLYTPGIGYPYKTPHCSFCPFFPHNPDSHFGLLKFSKPQQGFTCVTHAHLALALYPVMATSQGHLTSSASHAGFTSGACPRRTPAVGYWQGILRRPRIRSF